MKPIFTLILLLFAFSVPAFSNAEKFEDAEKKYRAGNYDNAIKIYESCIGENEISSNVYFNLGNCYYKKSDYIKAVLYYEKAAKYDPTNEDIQFNLEISRSRLSEENDSDNSGVSGWFYTIVNSRKADHWTWLAISLSIAGTVFLFLMFFSSQISLKRISLATAFISFAFSIVFALFSWYQISYFNSNDQALIISANSEARSEPNSDSKTVFIIPGGMKVKVLQEKDGWSEIVLNSNIGWVKSEEIEKI